MLDMMAGVFLLFTCEPKLACEKRYEDREAMNSGFYWRESSGTVRENRGKN